MDVSYLLSNPAALSQVFQSLQANDSKIIKSNEKILAQFLKDPQALIAILYQLKSNDPFVRHQAALYLKKKINNKFLKLSNVQQNEVKVNLLEALTTEQDRGVGLAIAGVVSSISKIVFNSQGGWPEIFTLLSTLAQQQDERLRGISYSLLDQLLEHIPEHLKPYTAVIVQMFLAGLQDPSIKVKTTTVTAMGSYIREMGDSNEVMLLQQLLTPLLTVLNASLSVDEDLVCEGLDVFQECCAIEQPLINDHIEHLIPFTVQIMQNEQFDSQLRFNAAQTLMTVIECRPKLMSKKSLVTPVLTVLMQIVAQGNSEAAGGLFSLPSQENKIAAGDNDDEEDEDFEDEMESIEKVALACVDQMALNIPPKHFVNQALTLCMQGLQSPEARMRKAGAVVIGVITEGCCNYLKPSLSNILQFLLPAVSDVDKSVRESACFTLGQFSEFCQPDILHFHAQIFPVIFNALDDPESTVQGTTCYILEYFCENLQRETLRPFLSTLMTKLATLLQNGSKTNKELALSATAATALATEIEFLPYAEAVCGILGQYLFVDDKNLFHLRGRSLECLGHIAIAIGEEHFARYFQHGMQSANTGILLDDDELKEHSYVFYANTAKVMKSSFTPYLPQLVPHLLEVAKESETEEEEAEEEDVDDDDEDGEKMATLNIYEGFVNNKKASLTALGALAEHLKEVFAPWIQQVVEMLMDQKDGCVHSRHEVIRAEAVAIMQSLVMSAAAATGITEAPQQGQILTLQPNLAHLNTISINACINVMREDVDMNVVSSACECVQGILNTLGVVALTDSFPTNDREIRAMDALAATIVMYLQEKAPCQEDYDEDPDDEDGSSTLVTDSISDLIGALAKAMGANFVPYFDAFVIHLMRYAKPDRPYTDRAMAIGCFGEVIGEIGQDSFKYKDVLLPLLQAGVADEIENVRRNSSFTLGALIRSSGVAMVPFFMAILQWLHPLCARRTTGTDTGGADVDNTLSTVAHMIKVSPDSIPLNQVLPVMLTALPLRSDHLEGENIYGCLISLIQANNVIATSMIVQIKEKLHEALQQTGTLEKTSLIINEFLAANP